MRPHANKLAEKRAEITKRYESELAGLERVERAYEVAERLLAEWVATKAGRDGSTYISNGAVFLRLNLSSGDIFADAADLFDRAQADLRACFPAEWTGDWSEVEDRSCASCAERGSTALLAPKGRLHFEAGVHLAVNVSAFVSDATACRVVQVGSKTVRESVVTEKVVPVFKAICPGDPSPTLQAAE